MTLKPFINRSLFHLARALKDYGLTGEGTGVGYKSYVTLLTSIGTSIQKADQVDELGVSNIYRGSTGQYTIEFSGPVLTSQKTIIFITNSDFTGVGKVTVYQSDPAAVTVHTFGGSGHADDILNYSSLEIRVYE